jgi:hypothetical protein
LAPIETIAADGDCASVCYVSGIVLFPDFVVLSKILAKNLWLFSNFLYFAILLNTLNFSMMRAKMLKIVDIKSKEKFYENFQII